MVEDAGGGGHNDDAEPTGGEQQVDPGLDLVNTDVVPRGDDAGLVETAVELHDDLAGAVVVNDLELADVAWERSSCQQVCNRLNVKRHGLRSETLRSPLDSLYRQVIGAGP